MEKIRLEILLFDLLNLGRVNIVELVKDGDMYSLYENYGDRESSDLINHWVESHNNLEVALARFEGLVAALQMIGYRLPSNGEELQLPGYRTSYAEKQQLLENLAIHTNPGHRLLDV
jgi:hypothetical protein